MTKKQPICWWCLRPAVTHMFDPYWQVEVTACQDHKKQLVEAVKQSTKAAKYLEAYVE